MRRIGAKTTKGSASAGVEANGSQQERRLATPDPRLVVVKVGEEAEARRIAPKGRGAQLIAGVAKLVMKPGADRKRLFASSVGKPVYAYSVYSKDPMKIVREDVHGRKILGRFADGRFRAIGVVEAE